MARYRTTIHSRLSPEEAFSYLADFSHSATWDPGVVEARRLEEGAVHEGSRFALVASFAGRRVSLEYAVTTFDPPRRVVFTAENGLFRSLDTISFAADTDGTQVTYSALLQPRGAFRLLDWALALTFKGVGDRARDGLRRALNP
jgi:hypothetical protein